MPEQVHPFLRPPLRFCVLALRGDGGKKECQEKQRQGRRARLAINYYPREARLEAFPEILYLTKFRDLNIHP